VGTATGAAGADETMLVNNHPMIINVTGFSHLAPVGGAYL